MAKIYVASSWRNTKQQELISQLRQGGHKVYDFTRPNGEQKPNVWDDIHLNHDLCSSGEYVSAISNPDVIRRYDEHFKAMSSADTCILLLPCGNSAHSEAGFMAGMFKRVYVFTYEENLKPELMYRLYDGYTNNITDLLKWLSEPFSGVCRICSCSEKHYDDHDSRPLWADKDKTVCINCAQILIEERAKNKQYDEETDEIFR